MRPALWSGGALLLVIVAFVALRREEPSTPPPSVPTRNGPPGPPVAPAAVVKRELPSRKALVAELPAAYSEHAQALLLSTEPEDRRKAGEAIAAAPAAARLPAYLQGLARLETIADCEARRPILLQLEAADDIRALWGLRILHESPRDGCKAGRGKQDCLGCLREDLARITAVFEASAE